jgi:signal peptidase I
MNAAVIHKHGRLRTAIDACVWLLLAGIMLETWLVAGLVVPCRVVGGSMAETLLGVHRQVVCVDCGHRFACGTDEASPAPRAVCPNCGYAANDIRPLPDLDGDRLLIDRAAFSLRPPRRWEVVALRHPRHADEILVKRVVGLPGELIEIRDGDVYADGQIQRKDLAEQHALAILVHDADCRPTLDPAIPPRWRPERRDSRWQPAAEGFSHPAGPQNGPIDWLVYHHVRRVAAAPSDARWGGSGTANPGAAVQLPPQQVVESPVTDVCGYNQSQPRRDEDVHAVADLLLSFRLEPCGNGTFFVRAADGVDTFEVRLHFLGKGPETWEYEVFRGGKPIPGASGWVVHGERRFVEVSLIDQQFLLALDGRTLVACPYERPGRSPSPPVTPLAIGVQGDRLEATVRSLQVCRDVYYTQPMRPAAASATPAQVRLADDEYYVVGDNSPISDDSRTWPGGGSVLANLLIGKPLAAIPSVEINPGRGWRFQVPCLTAIRYIQ